MRGFQTAIRGVPRVYPVYIGPMMGQSGKSRDRWPRARVLRASEARGIGAATVT